MEVKNRVEYEGGPREFEDLDLGYNIVKIGAFGCNTHNPEKNKKGNDVSWWFSFQDVKNQSKSTLYSLTGNFEWEGGFISPKSFLLSKINIFLDAIGYYGGFQLDGSFEEQDKTPITEEEFFQKYGESMKQLRLAVYAYREPTGSYVNIWHIIKPEYQLEDLKKIVEHSLESGFLKIFNPNNPGLRRPSTNNPATTNKSYRL